MRKECKMVYTYDELDDRAKEKAREWFAELVFSDSCDWEFVYGDAEHMASIIGITIDDRPCKTIGGATRHEPCIWFSGFSSQGDGACFEGSYRYKKGAVKAIKAECNDEELVRIATELQAVQRRNFYRLYATCAHRGCYNHSGCMSVDVEDSENQYRDLNGDDEVVAQLLRDFADWIYSQLERDYNYQTSDEVVEENILGNEYEFYQSGERA